MEESKIGSGMARKEVVAVTYRKIAVAYRSVLVARQREGNNAETDTVEQDFMTTLRFGLQKLCESAIHSLR